MSGELLYLVSSVAAWVGWIALGFAAYRAVDALMKPKGAARQSASRGFISSAATAAIALLVSTGLPKPGAPTGEGGWRLPLVWPVMPFAAWAVVACLCFAAYRFFQVVLDPPVKQTSRAREGDLSVLSATEERAVAEAISRSSSKSMSGSEMASSDETQGSGGGTATKVEDKSQIAETIERSVITDDLAFRNVSPRRPQLSVGPSDLQRTEHYARIRQSIGGLILAAGFFWIFKKSGDTIDIVRGGIPFQTGTATAVILFAVLALIAMAIAGQYTASRGVAKKIVLHVMLVIGSIVFGLPFLWLVITSFKEDQDMSSANGLIWIPKVTEQMPYRDPSNPYYQGTHQGQTVEADLIEKEPNGQLKLNVAHPMSLQGATFLADPNQLKELDRMGKVVTGTYNGQTVTGHVVREYKDGHEMVSILSPPSVANQTFVAAPSDLEPVRHVGLNWANYPGALDYLPPEAHEGLTYLWNTLILVLFNVIGTILSSSIVAYAFARFTFPGKGLLFTVLISTMMLPAAITLLPQFLIFKTLGWVDTLYPLWVPAFFASAFNVFLLRQFFMTVPKELEDASKIDGCSYLKTFWSVMMPQVKPALAVIAIWTFMGVWNNFMGPLVYINSPEHMPISYAVQLFQGDHQTEPGFLMAFATMSMIPVLALFFGAQKYFIEGVTLSGLGGR